MEAGRWRTRLTLSDLLAVQHSSNLRDLLGYREEEGGGHQALLRSHGHGRGGGGETLTLASALAYEKGEASSTPIPSGRTLLDIFRDDDVGPVTIAVAGGGGGGRTLLDIFREDEGAAVAGGGDNFIWRTFDEHLRPSVTASPCGDPPATTGGAPLEEASVGEAADGGDEADPSGTAAEGEQPARVSLMALLEATEGQMDSGGEVWTVAVEEEEEEEGEMVAGEEEQADRHVCCVCAERRKGAAFVPCGHTFCRVCSRVLFKRRGSCPLCNAHIVQVLHIY